MNTPENGNSGPMQRVLRVRALVSELSRVHTDQVDEAYMEQALRQRARVLRAIVETHGVSPLLESDHEAVVQSNIRESIRIATRLYETTVGIRLDSPELLLHPDGRILPSPSDSEKSS